MSKQFKIGNFVVGNNLNPYIIAEIGVNHEGSMKLAKKMIMDAAEAGAHAAKFQSYKAGLIASKNSPAYWDQTKEPTASQYELFKKFDAFGEKEYLELASYCNEVGIDFMSTPFDLGAVDFLEPIVPAFKIASADITNVPLIRKCARTKKPLIMSTGAATLPEIEFAVQTAREAGAKDIALLHCVLNYPTPEENASLGLIKELERVFSNEVIGYSDHVVPDETISALEAAMLLGATILEKHYTHDKSLPGNDHYHSMDKDDLKAFTRKIEKYRTMIISEGFARSEESAARRHARRSIVAAKDLKKGDVLTEENIIAKRPAHGVSPMFWDDFIGKKLNKNKLDDELIKWEDLE